MPRRRPPRGLTSRTRIAPRLRTLRGQAIYGLRMLTAESVHGKLKQAMGFRQFLLRDLAKVRGERGLLCAAFYLRKLCRAAYR